MAGLGRPVQGARAAGSLQLVKRVVNDNGGTKTVADFGVGTTAGSLTFDAGVADGTSTIKYTSNALTVSAGSYSLTETDLAGYSEGSWSCTGGTANPTTFSAGSVAVANGATVVCTLEPCNHTGSTGPCSQALIDAGLPIAAVAWRWRAQRATSSRVGGRWPTWPTCFR